MQAEELIDERHVCTATAQLHRRRRAAALELCRGVIFDDDDGVCEDAVERRQQFRGSSRTAESVFSQTVFQFTKHRSFARPVD